MSRTRYLKGANNSIDDLPILTLPQHPSSTEQPMDRTGGSRISTEIVLYRVFTEYGELGRPKICGAIGVPLS